MIISLKALYTPNKPISLRKQEGNSNFSSSSQTFRSKVIRNLKALPQKKNSQEEFERYFKRWRVYEIGACYFLIISLIISTFGYEFSYSSNDKK